MANDINARNDAKLRLIAGPVIQIRRWLNWDNGQIDIWFVIL